MTSRLPSPPRQVRCIADAHNSHAYDPNDYILWTAVDVDDGEDFR